MDKGVRVGALSHSDGETVYLFGYGTFEGYEVPPTNIKFMGLYLARPNPKIQLDNGQVVWGCECWWGPESAIQAVVNKATRVITVDIDVARARAQANWDATTQEDGD